MAVNDAYRLFPWADVLYGCDAHWWEARKGVPDFAGERWTSVHDARSKAVFEVAKRYQLRVIRGQSATFFSQDPRCIHYGYSSGFQGLNLALLFGAQVLPLIGFDYRNHLYKSHFFGSHQPPLKDTGNFEHWLTSMNLAAKRIPFGAKIINCTPDSAIEGFPRGDLKEVLDGFAACHAAE